MKPWPLVILILALGASAINAWYYGSLIVDDRARANDAWYRERQTGANPWRVGSTISPDSEAVWLTLERRAWRLGGTIQIAIVTLAGVSYALVRSGRTAARP